MQENKCNFHKFYINRVNQVKEKVEETIPAVEIQKYEIKLVSKHRFPSNFNIKSIDNLPILKN